MEEKQLTKEKQEEEIEAHIKWNNERYAPFELELIRKSDLRKLKVKHYLNSALVMLGLIIIAGSIFYLGYGDKFKSDINCGNSTAICGDLKCEPCSACNCGDLTCGNLSCNFPKELKINMTG